MRIPVLLLLASPLAALPGCVHPANRLIDGPPTTRDYRFGSMARDTGLVADLSGQGPHLGPAGDSAPPQPVQHGAIRAVRVDSVGFRGTSAPVSDQGFAAFVRFRHHGPGTERGNGGALNGLVLAEGNGYWEGWRLVLQYPENTLTFNLGRPSPVNAFAMSSPPIAPGVWHDIVADWDREHLTLYVDGIPVAQAAYGGEYTEPADGTGLAVGFAGYGVGSALLDVAELRLYPRSLSPTEALTCALDHPVSERRAARIDQAARAMLEGDRQAATVFYRDAGRHLDPESLLSLRLRAGELRGLDTVTTDRIPKLIARTWPAIAGSNHPLASPLRVDAIQRIIACVATRKGHGLSSRLLEDLLGSAGQDLSEHDLIELTATLAETLAAESRPDRAAGVWHQLLDRSATPCVTLRDADLHLRAAESLRHAGAIGAARELCQGVRESTAPAPARAIAAFAEVELMLDTDATEQARSLLQALASDSLLLPHHRAEATDRLGELAGEGRVQPPTGTGVGPGLTLYVLPTAGAFGDGTEASPYGSLEQARDAIRSWRREHDLPPGGIEVRLLPGTYAREEAFVLEEQDSGAPGHPIRYRCTPAGSAVLSGGTELTGFRPVTDPLILERLPDGVRGRVLELNLAGCGVRELPPLRQRGFGHSPSPQPELYIDGNPLDLARWPNEGFVHTEHVLPRGAGYEFTCDEDRLSRWTAARDAWMLGYWYHHWASDTLAVTAVDTANRRVLTDQSPSYGMRDGQHFRFFNLLEEIDEPGEWYVDRETLTLYVYPSAPADQATIQLALLQSPFLVCRNVSHVQFSGLTCELGAFSGAEVQDGDDVRFTGCTFRRLAGDAIVFTGGTNHRVLGCDLHTLGRGGVRVHRSGDRRSLTPGNMVVENNHIHDFSRIDRSYTPAVHMEGVGGRIRHNLMHDSPHHAIRLDGNDHLVEYNEIHSVVYESDDQSGIDMWGDPTYRGNVIRYNLWHHIGSGLNVAGQAGIRLDDAICGVLVYGNVFLRSADGQFGAVQIHGGKENLIDNNLFLACRSAVSFSSWGEERWLRFLADHQAQLHDQVEVSRPPYATRYPALEQLEQGADINHVWRNLIVDCPTFLLRDHGRHGVFANRTGRDTAAFVGIHDRTVVLRKGTGAEAPLGFRPIPIERIGLYPASERASRPVESRVTTHYAGTLEVTEENALP